MLTDEQIEEYDERVDETGINVYRLVTKLVGPIEPVGETHEDTKRLDNLKHMVAVVSMLIEDIGVVAEMEDRFHQASIKEAGGYAFNFLRSLVPDEVV
jgi:hypothetical protein